MTSTDRPDPDDLVVLVHEPDGAEDLVRLLRERDVPGRLLASSDEESAGAQIADCHVLVSGPFPAAPLARAKNLVWIQSLWAGVDSWRAAPPPADVRLTRMTDIHATYMAEYVFAHLLSSTQHVADLRVAQEARRWRPELSRRLQGPLGVAGWGAVGSRIGHLAAAFGLPVRGLRRGAGSVVPGEVPIYGLPALGTFLAGLRILVVALPATPETRGLIGEDEIAQLAPGAVLVNVGRGEVVDEEAVVAALHDGRLGRAVLDTFAVEPLPPSSPLWTPPGCVVTPHVSGPTDLPAAADVVARNLAVFLRGGWPEPVVDLDRGY